MCAEHPVGNGKDKQFDSHGLQGLGWMHTNEMFNFRRDSTTDIIEISRSRSKSNHERMRGRHLRQENAGGTHLGNRATWSCGQRARVRGQSHCELDLGEEQHILKYTDTYNVGTANVKTGHPDSTRSCWRRKRCRRVGETCTGEQILTS